MSLLAFTTNCVHIKRIAISGHDKCKGRVTSVGLKALQKDKRIAKELVCLDLMDKRVGAKECSALSKARKGLAIRMGETAGDGFTAQ